MSDEVGDALDDDPCLSGAGSGEEHEGSVEGVDGLLLLRVAGHGLSSPP